MKTRVRFRVNGTPADLNTDDERRLLWVLRTDLNLTGTKYGCGSGYCGACTVVVGKEAVRSCRTTLKEVQGKEVVTIEGLAKDGKLDPLQRAFMEHGGLQCGYCTSGMIMSASALLLADPHPTREATRAASSTTSAVAARTDGSSRRSKTPPAERGPRHERLRRNRSAPLLPAHGRRHCRVHQVSDRGSSSASSASPSYPEDINAYLLIGADGRVKVFSGKIEMGQGVMTSQAQMAAEELGVAVRIDRHGPRRHGGCVRADMGTFGSMTTLFFGPALRAAAAEALGRCSRSWRPRSSGSSPAVLVVEKGVVSVAGDAARKTTYGEPRRASGSRASWTGKP